jgi:hypothetical protein
MVAVKKHNKIIVNFINTKKNPFSNILVVFLRANLNININIDHFQY